MSRPEPEHSHIRGPVEKGEEVVISRTGGALAGQIVLSEDWDSPEVNAEIARDFGLDQCATRGLSSDGRPDVAQPPHDGDHAELPRCRT